MVDYWLEMPGNGKESGEHWLSVLYSYFGGGQEVAAFGWRRLLHISQKADGQTVGQVRPELQIAHFLPHLSPLNSHRRHHRHSRACLARLTFVASATLFLPTDPCCNYTHHIGP